jgi:hypothetical protein
MARIWGLLLTGLAYWSGMELEQADDLGCCAVPLKCLLFGLAFFVFPGIPPGYFRGMATKRFVLKGQIGR